MEDENNRPFSLNTPDVYDDPISLLNEYYNNCIPISIVNPSATTFPNSVEEVINSQPYYDVNFTSNVHTPQPVTSIPAGAIPYPGFLIVAPAIVSTVTTYDAALIASMKNCLRLSGFSGEALSEVTSALDTLANYGVLSRLYGLLNGIYGAPCGGFYGVRMPISALAVPAVAVPREPNQEIYHINRFGRVQVDSDPEDISPSMEAGPHSPDSKGTLDTDPPRVEIDLDTDTNSRYDNVFNVPDEEGPFRRTPSEFDAPSIALLPFNNNSFGLVTGPNAWPYCLGNNRSLFEREEIVTINLETDEDGSNCWLEIPEYIFQETFGLEGEKLSDVEDRCGVKIDIYRRRTYTRGCLKRHVTIAGVPLYVSHAQNMIKRQLEKELEKTNQLPAFVGRKAMI